MANSNTMDLAIQIHRADRCEIVSELVAVIKFFPQKKGEGKCNDVTNSDI